MWDLILSAGASLLGGYLQGQGASAAGEASADAANSATALNKQIYGDQRALFTPAYLTGGAAANKLAALYGIAPQNYEAASQSGLNSSGNLLSSSLGGGQPVAGHSGGGGQNMLMPLVRNGGDNWSTIATEAPAGFDYNAYWNDNPDFATATNGWNKPENQALFGGNRDAYLNWHYNNFGKAEGRTLKPLSTGTTTTGTTTGATGTTQTAADPMADFMGSMENRLATQMSDIDFGKIKSQLGAAGKSISGAGEKRYAKTLAGNRYGAFGDYTNGLRSIAGMNQTASSQIGNAGSTYATNAGNSMMAAGQAKGNALAGAYKGYGQGISGAVGAVNDYGKSNWGWA